MTMVQKSIFSANMGVSYTIEENKARNGVCGAFKANYKGINEVCKKVDELQTVPSIITLWVLEVGPFLKDIPTSHFIFMQEYFEAKIYEHK